MVASQRRHPTCSFRKIAAAAVIAIGMGLTVAFVQLAKHDVDRPRPANALVDAAGSAYPSGQGAYAMAWIALAVVAVRVVPALRGRWWIVIAAIVLAALTIAGDSLQIDSGLPAASVNILMALVLLAVFGWTGKKKGAAA